MRKLHLSRALFLVLAILLLALTASCSSKSKGTKLPDPTCTCPNGCNSDGSCKPECTIDTDCPAGENCLDGVCVAPDGDGGDTDVIDGEGGDKDGGESEAAENEIERDSADPWLKVDPESLNFGAVAQFDTLSKELKLRNMGAGTLTVTAIHLLGGAGNVNSEIHFDGATLPLSLAQDEEKSIFVKYSPIDLTPDNDTLRIESNDPAQAKVDVPITTEVKAFSIVTITPPTIEFGVVRLGHYESLVSIKNEGGRVTSILKFALTTASGMYSLKDIPADVTSVNPLRIPANTTYTFHVAYDPTVADGLVDNASLDISVSSDEGEKITTIPISGTPCEPQIDILPTVVDFTDVGLGQSVTKCATVTNKGCWALDLTKIELTDDADGCYAFAPVVSTPKTLAKDESADVCVAFTPTLTTDGVGRVIVTNSDPKNPAAPIDLAGKVVPPDIDCTPLALDFGNVPIGTTQPKSITCRNTSAGRLTISQYNLSSPDGRFKLLNTPTTVLELNDSTTFDISFESLAEAASNGSLTIESNDPDESPLLIPITAKGYNPNTCPVAHITVLSPADLTTVQQFDTLSLSAASSYDPDAGDTIARYEWTVLAKPTGSFAALLPANPNVPNQSNDVAPTLNVDLPGDYRVGLKVYDQKNLVSCETAELVFSVKPAMPSLSCDPQNHDYGVQAINSTTPFSFLCTNNGLAVLHISQVELLMPDGPVYSITSQLGNQIGITGSSFLEVTYKPTATGTFTGTVRIHSDDPVHPIYDLTLRGGSEHGNTCPTASFVISSPAITDIHLYDTVHFDASASSDPDPGDSLTMYVWEVLSKPAGSRADVTPFGAVTPSMYIDAVGTYKVQLLVKDTFNTFSCTAATVEFTAKVPPPAISCTPLVLNYGTLAIGQSQTQGVTCKNVGLGPLTFTSFTVTNANTPNAFLLTNTPATTLLANESTMIAVTYTSNSVGSDSGNLRILSNDPQLPQIDVPLMANSYDPNTCPTAAVTVLSPNLAYLKPLDTVQFDAGASSDPDAGDGIAEYIYTVLVRPPGSTAPIVQQTANRARASLFVDLAGHYTIQVQVRDKKGLISCNKALVEMDAIPREAIHVQLVWSTSEGDFDLHLVKPGSSIWNSDCYYSSKTPSWGSYGNPTLDIDDQHGYGPENINLDNPGTGAYKVYVHYYDSWGEHSTATVTVRIYIHGVIAGTYLMSWPESREHYRWAVATINWDATQGTGSVSPISTSLEADGTGAKAFPHPPKQPE